MPLVSVVIPTYNRAALLAQAIDSVLAQTFADYEVIVVDDGSTDRTAAVVEAVADRRVSLISLPHSGLPARVRNAGIKRARGRYIAFLDSDDLWDPSKLDEQLAALAARPDCRWCHTGGRCIDEAGAPHPRWPMPRLASEGWIAEPLLRRRAGVNSSSVLVDGALLRDVGGFDETFVWGEDYDLWVRLALRSPIACVRDPRVQRRIHAIQFVGSGWEQPVLRTLGKTARSAPTWRLRALSAREALKVGAWYASRRARALLRGRSGRQTDALPAGRG
jgi:glycosyltransferase involved in cell wall biosynthesis